MEIQGSRANDIKHSASWEATQVFLNFDPEAMDASLTACSMPRMKFTRGEFSKK